MAGYLITDVRIFDGSGREPFAGSVRVEGNRITDVRSRPTAAWSSTAAAAR
jgi:N-acyl-D-aspartate/D-glutamate deacylase